MSDDMTHERAREALEAMALDALDASERDAVMAHVATCERCQSELAALVHTTDALVLAADPIPMRPAQRDRIRARLLARAAADRASVDHASLDRVTTIRPAARRRISRPTALWAAAASVIALLGIGAYLRASRDSQALRAALQVAQSDRGARVAMLDSLRTSVAERDSMIANLTGPRVKVMTLVSAGPPTPMGRLFWDQTHNAWTLVAHHVPMPKAGRTYQLWLMTPTSKISAGTFAPSPNGDVMMRATYELAGDSLAAIAVTDEPGSGSAQPTTAPIMIASK